MTDKEIIQAWKCHISRSLDDCKQCPYKDLKPKGCQEKLYEDIADLIKSQQAEIEQLKTEKDNLIKTYAECRIDFLKEFVEKLKDRTAFYQNAGTSSFIEGCIETKEWYDSKIEELVKEMVGADNDT